MRSRIQPYLSPPVFDDPKKTKTARGLHYSLLALALFLLVITVPIPFSSIDSTLKREFFTSQVALLFALFCSWVMMRRGSVWSVAFVTVATIFVGTAYSHLYIYGTINSLSVIGYFVLIPLTGLLFGWRSMWIAVVVSASALLLGFYLEMQGFVEPYNHVVATSVDLIFLLTCLGLNTALALALLTEAEESAQLAQRSAADLSESNRELQTSQQALQHARDGLELRVMERTDELNAVNLQLTEEVAERKHAEEILRVAKEEAEAATRAKSAFLANMSHEIRTPMNGVIAMTSLLMETKMTAGQREYTQVIRRSSDALLAVIDDILDFSRIESGKWKLDREPYNMHACVADAVEVVASRAAEKRLELAYFVEFDVPTMIIGDGTRVRQILINLVSNAVKFTDEGEVYAKVTANRMADRRYTIQFDVRDTGIGIQPTDQKQLFQSFSQVDVSNTRRHTGSGLGLAISQGLVDLMGGEIWVTSEADVGSTFHFAINVDAADDEGGPATAWVHEALGSHRVLLLSEHETTRTILSSYLAHWGMETLDVQTREDALGRVADGEAVDVVICELQGETDAIVAAIDSLRTGSPDLPIIFFISLHENEIRRRLADYDNLTILHKPVKPSVLYDSLQRWFGVAGVPQDDGSLDRAEIDSTIVAESISILLVEDNPINQRVAIHLIQHLGYSCDLARNGLEAIAAIRAQPYDIVFMDIQMPEMDGLEATRLIRQDQSLARQPYIIALTAAALPEEREQCLAAGMDDFIAKPIRLDGLAEVVNGYRISEG